MKRYPYIVSTLPIGILAACAGCQSTGRTAAAAVGRESQAAPTPRAAAATPPVKRATSGAATHRLAMTAEDNPTARAGRGTPSLNEFFRPAAWVYLDGKEGSFIERDGQPQIQWVIEDPVSTAPTFRVEAFEPLLGEPKNFVCTLHTQEAADGSKVAYAIKAADDTFQVGRPYSLLRPGDNFVIRNLRTGDVVSEIAPLAPGTYLLAAGIKNLQTGRECLAVTQFTVGGGR